MRHPFVGACAVYAGFLALTLFVYRGLWSNLYYTDDYLWLSIAQDVAREPWRLIVFEPDNAAAGVRAVQRALFGALYAVFGVNAAAYHMTSIVLHALNATLVFGLIRLLVRDAASIGRGRERTLAVFGAFVFATTSLHAGAVIWLSTMSTLLATASLIVLFRYVLIFETRLDDVRVLLGAAAIFVFALACKNTAVSFPLILGAYLLILSPRRHVGGGRWRLVTLLAVIGVAQVLFTKIYVGRMDLPSVWGTSGAYALSANVPLNLLGAFMANVVSARTYERFLPDVPYVYVAVPLLIAMWALLRQRSAARPGLFGLTWILVAALPVALFDYRQYSGEQTMVTRYYYAPLVGGTIVLVSLVATMVRTLRSTKWIGVIVVVASVAHALLHLPTLRKNIAEIESYGATRMLLFDSTWDAVENRLGPQTEVYALEWPVPAAALTHIGRHFFLPRGVTLRGAGDLDAFAGVLPDDGVARYVAHWDAATTMLTVRPIH